MEKYVHPITVFKTTNKAFLYFPGMESTNIK